MAYVATLTRTQAIAISTALYNQMKDSSFAINSQYSVTGTRATLHCSPQFEGANTFEAKLYSNYLHDDVINEVPSEFQHLFSKSN